MNNPGMLLWLWLLVAPPIAMMLMSGAGSNSNRDDRTNYGERPRD